MKIESAIIAGNSKFNMETLEQRRMLSVSVSDELISENVLPMEMEEVIDIAPAELSDGSKDAAEAEVVVGTEFVDDPGLIFYTMFIDEPADGTDSEVTPVDYTGEGEPIDPDQIFCFMPLVDENGAVIEEPEIDPALIDPAPIDPAIDELKRELVDEVLVDPVLSDPIFTNVCILTVDPDNETVTTEVVDETAVDETAAEEEVESPVEVTPDSPEELMYYTWVDFTVGEPAAPIQTDSASSLDAVTGPAPTNSAEKSTSPSVFSQLGISSDDDLVAIGLASEEA